MVVPTVIRAILGPVLQMVARAAVVMPVPRELVL